MVVFLFNYICAFEMYLLYIDDILLHITEPFLLGSFVEVSRFFLKSPYVRLLNFLMESLASTRNRNDYIILSKAVINEVVKVAVCLIDLVDLL